jgi:hypothetical protein
MTKRPVEPKKLNAAAFKKPSQMFAQRVTPYWCAIDGGEFLIRPLTGRYGLYAEKDAFHGMKALIADVRKVVEDDGTPIAVTFEEVTVLDKPIQVLSDETVERIPINSWEKLMDAAGAVTMLSKEELLKQDFILPLQSATSSV